MDIKIQKQNGCYIFNIESEELLAPDIKGLASCVFENSNSRKFALNLNKVKKIDDSFFDFMKKTKCSICGISHSVLAYFSIRNTINFTPIYLSVDDFIQNKRRIVKRNFKIL